MNINKKFDRLKQWTGEKMGQESKTAVSEEFKALEMEMTLRHEGKPPPPSACVARAEPDQAWTDCKSR